MASHGGRQFTSIAVVAGVALGLIIASLSIINDSSQSPTYVPVTVANNVTSKMVAFNSRSGESSSVGFYVNVSSQVIVNASGASSSFSMTIKGLAEAESNSGQAGIAFVFFLFDVNISGNIASPLTPNAVQLVVDDLGNTSSEVDPVTIAFFSVWPGVSPDNISDSPSYISSQGFSGRGSMEDNATLANVSPQRSSDFRFSLPLQVEMSASPIPVNTTAIDTFHLWAYLDGIGPSVYCSATISEYDTYSG